ncbi:MAG: hypothetical protein AAGD05_05955, partial [Bacteroidota bacterium]
MPPIYKAPSFMQLSLNPTHQSLFRSLKQMVLTISLCTFGLGLFAQPLQLVLPFSHDTRITAMAFSPDGQYLVTADLDGWIKVWEMTIGAPVQTYRAHRQKIEHLSFYQTNRFVSASIDGSICQWKIGTDRFLQRRGQAENPIKVIALAKSLPQALVFYEGQYQYWDLNELRVMDGHGKKGLSKIPPITDDTRQYCSADLRYLAQREA